MCGSLAWSRASANSVGRSVFYVGAESLAGTIVRAAAVEVCEPRQGREAAALSIPSRRRGYNLDKSGSLRAPR